MHWREGATKTIVMSNEMLGKEVSLDYGAIQSQLSFLQGKVLTVIDASYNNERQLKAVKDLVKSAFHEQQTWILQICFPEAPITSRDSLKASGVDVDAIERGAVQGQ